MYWQPWPPIFSHFWLHIDAAVWMFEGEACLECDVTPKTTTWNCV